MKWKALDGSFTAARKVEMKVKASWTKLGFCVSMIQEKHGGKLLRFFKTEDHLTCLQNFLGKTCTVNIRVRAGMYDNRR
jgi:hypothetical protein